MLSNTNKLKGLYTFGNELIQPEGSVSIADNINIDEPNVFSQRRGFHDYADLIDSSETRIRQLMVYKNTLIRHYNGILEFYNNGIFDKFDGTYLELDPDIRLKYVEMNSNLYFTTSEGVKKISALNATDFSTNAGYITNSGVPEALDVSGKIVYQSNGFLPPLSKVAYKVLFGQKDVNNNLLLGTPSSRYVVTNSSQDIFTYEKTNLVFKQNESYHAQVSVVTCGNKNNTNETNGTNPDSILLVSNADNVNKYAFWFNKGTGIAPVLTGYTAIEVNISTLGPSDNVGTMLYNTALNASLVGITLSQPTTSQITFTNTSEGLSDGENSPNNNLLTDIGGGWAVIITTLGTDSEYIKKYFIVHTKDTDYCFYYGNTRTIGNVPDDPLLIGMTFVGIEIGNDSGKLFIANKTATTLRTTLIGSYTIDLNASGSNPIVALTDVTGGNIEDVGQGTILTSVMEVIISNQGSITNGQFANVDVTFTVPNGIDDKYFYQIYRTGIITVTEGLTLADIDPGEELNLVYEHPVNAPMGSKITITDITNEAFRNSGLPLYNNAISGEGVLQSNDKPPVSKDINIYKGYTFYGNTNLVQQQSLTSVSVDGFVSGVTKIALINNTTKREYTFRGTSSKNIITTSTKANTKILSLANPDSKIYLFSALDSSKYVVYFDDGTATKPTEADYVQIRVDISNLAPTDSVVDILALTLAQFSDFSITKVGNDIHFDNTENGFSTNFTTPNNNIVIDIGTGWALSNTEVGTGEDASLGFILLSKSASVGLKIERTIRSMVSVLNADLSGLVNAYYTSSLTDLPGKFLLKSRSMDDINFYFTIIDGVSTNFNPEIPSIDTSLTFTSIAAGPNNTTILGRTAHGFVNGEQVFISVPNAIPTIMGSFKVTVLTADTISIIHQYISGNTTGSYFFFPFEKSDNLKSPNRIYYSKINQPEAVPLINYIDVGTKDAPIERILSLRDYLFIIKTDGIYILSGTNAQFTIEKLDTEKILCPDSAVVLNNQIYMLTNNGVVTLNESSPMIISRMIENKFQVTNKYRALVRRQGFGISYTDDRAYLVWLPSSEVDTISTQCFRYNILEKTWTRWTKSASCGVVVDIGSSLMYIGDGERPIIMEERKNLDRTDFADKDFQVSMGIEALVNNRYKISDTTEVEEGDVISQTQYVNVSEYNRFLQKLDLDPGLNYTDFFNLYSCNEADNLAAQLIVLNIKLVDLDTSGNVTIHTYDNNNWVEMQTHYNNLIDELNIINTSTQFKDYMHSEGSLEFEYVVTAVYKLTNEISIFEPTEFVQGDLTIYKRIVSVGQMNPITFGDPSVFKQINKGYLLFDQNNFFRMVLEYSTDLSQSFDGHTFRGKGAGFWGSSTWGFEDKNYWGGDGNDAPRRVIIPKNKQRCRYIVVRFTHSTARDMYKITGVAHDVRSFSALAYK